MGQRENRTGLFEIPQAPSLTDLFRVALRNLQLQMRTHSVATVVTYNPATQRADVQVDILQVIKDNNASPSAANPAPTFTQPPVLLKDIPVAWPRAGGGYLTFPLQAGDKGELHVQDRSIQQWLELGVATDPVSAFTHTLADSVFHPNIQDKLNPITPPTDQTATVLDGTTLVKVGRGATDFVALAALVLARLNALHAWALTHVHAGVTPGVGSSGVAAPTVPPLPPTAAPVAATKAQAE